MALTECSDGGIVDQRIENFVEIAASDKALHRLAGVFLTHGFERGARCPLDFAGADGAVTGSCDLIASIDAANPAEIGHISGDKCECDDAEEGQQQRHADF